MMSHEHGKHGTCIQCVSFVRGLLLGVGGTGCSLVFPHYYQQKQQIVFYQKKNLWHHFCFHYEQIFSGISEVDAFSQNKVSGKCPHCCRSLTIFCTLYNNMALHYSHSHRVQRYYAIDRALIMHGDLLLHELSSPGCQCFCTKSFSMGNHIENDLEQKH